MNKNKILVVGDIMVDHYIYGNCNRISPEAPVPVVEFVNENYTLGGAGNVLKNLYALGYEGNIVSVTGEDDGALLVENHLKGLQNDAYTLIKDQSRCTTIKSRVMVSNHQLIRLDREISKPIALSITAQIISLIESVIDGYDLVLLSDYGKGLLSNELIAGIVTLCKNKQIKIVLDPKGADFSKYHGVNIIKPNKKEAAIASGITINSRESLLMACEKIKEITNCDDVIITMSEEGIALFSNDKLDVIPTKALDVVDVTGAGDTVLASLGVALLSGKSLHEACEFANHAAAVVVSKVGSATVTMDEINARL